MATGLSAQQRKSRPHGPKAPVKKAGKAPETQESDVSSQQDLHLTIWRSRNVRVVYTEDKIWEAPNWSTDGNWLVANSGGVLYRIPVSGGVPVRIGATGFVRVQQRSRDISGREIGCDFCGSWKSERLAGLRDHHGLESHLGWLHKTLPSYFHGWSPDGNWLAFVGERGGHFNIFPGCRSRWDEERLTSAPAYDDGPDYSPDGNWIYIKMTGRSADGISGDFRRMAPEQTTPKAERVTSDDLEDWFPHPSPDGKWLDASFSRMAQKGMT